MENSNEPKVEKHGRKQRVRHWVFSILFKHGVLYSLAFSLLILAAYTVGSIYDPAVSDRILFLMLRLLWYSSLLLCLFSLISMGAKVRRMVYNPGIRNALGLLSYFTASLFGAAIAIISSFIVAASGGNV